VAQDPRPRPKPVPSKGLSHLFIKMGSDIPYSSQPHTITIDVAQSLDDIQAPGDAVKSTAIALVRVDSNFLPGTTIGATHWVAYAMTRGMPFFSALVRRGVTILLKVVSVSFLVQAAIVPCSSFRECFPRVLQ